MRSFRTAFFWLHLTAGLIAGVVIFVMCVTGALLAFERQIIELSEAEARWVVDRDRSEMIGPSEALAAVMELRPDAKPSAISIRREAGGAWEVSLGRDGSVFVDPYNGVITGESNKTVRDAMSALREWHRWLALSGDQRPIGKAITGTSNLLFLFLALSGIYIWFPRNLIWKAVRPVIWFRTGQSGKARDFNWHNTIGFWTSLFLIVFTITATVISYQWASNLLYTLTGNEVPVPRSPSASRGKAEETNFAVPEGLSGIWATAEERSPTWKSISLRLPASGDSLVFTIDEGIYWNIFGRSTLTLSAKDPSLQRWEPYGERNTAVQLRSWFRFTHTGETGGLIGQLIGFIACVGGAFLVWTGLSLALRRFGNFIKRHRRAEVER
ncbi:MAG: PepSY-associated TM helix domain-containing protein [Pyrinomonadaceae bacterium]